MREVSISIEAARLAVHRLRQRRRVGLSIVALGVLCVAASFIPPAKHALATLPLGLMGALIGAMVVASARRDPNQTLGRRGLLSFDGTRLEAISGPTRVALGGADLQSGWLEEGEDQRLVLQTRAGDVIEAEIEPDAGEAARAMLHALGLDARAVRMTCGATTATGRSCATGCVYLTALFGLPWAAVTVVAAVFLLSGDPMATTVFLLSALIASITGMVLWVAFGALATAEIAIGNDGVHVKRLFRERFVPFGRVDDVIRRSQKAIVETDRGAVEIPCQTPKAAEMVVNRLQRALDAWRRAERAVDVTALDRRDLAPPQWHARMRELLDRASLYRARALRPDDLWRVVEDPSAQPERRVGAALALSSHCAADDRARLRIAADGCAQDALRTAMARAAEGELEAEALDEAMAVFGRRS